MRFTYTDQNRLKNLKEFTEMQPLADYLKKQNLVEKFADFAANNGMRRRNLMIMKSHSLLEQFLDGRIIYNLLDEQAWNEYINANDPTVLAAIRVFKTGAFLSGLHRRSKEIDLWRLRLLAHLRPL